MERVWHVWLSGGWVMVPLFLVAVLLYAQAFQLLLYLRRTHLDQAHERLWWEWVRRPDRAEGRVAEIIRYAQADVQSARQIRSRFDEMRLSIVAMIERRARFLGTLVAVAPLMGLLGTVLGMLKTFLGLSTSAGSETAGVVAGGISEALITTETGLVIALPGLFLVMLIQRKRHALEAQLARLESLTLSHLRFE